MPEPVRSGLELPEGIEWATLDDALISSWDQMLYGEAFVKVDEHGRAHHVPHADGVLVVEPAE